MVQRLNLKPASLVSSGQSREICCLTICFLKHFMQSTGTFIAASRFAGATAPPAHVLSRSIGLQVLSLSSLLHFLLLIYFSIFSHMQ